jgi:chromosome segregation ATPase
MEDHWPAIGSLIVAVIAAISSLYAVMAQRRTSHETHEIGQAAAIVTGYDNLVRRLSEELLIKSKEIADLHSRLTIIEQDMRVRNEAEAGMQLRISKLETEREVLIARIARLETERDELREELVRLQGWYTKSHGNPEQEEDAPCAVT